MGLLRLIFFDRSTFIFEFWRRFFFLLKIQTISSVMPILYGHSISLVGDLLVCFLFIDKLIDDLIFGQQKKKKWEESVSLKKSKHLLNNKHCLQCILSMGRSSDVCLLFSLDSMRHKQEHISISMLASTSIGAEVLLAKNQFDDDIRWFRTRTKKKEEEEKEKHLRMCILFLWVIVRRVSHEDRKKKKQLG